ncbi:MAG: hypothetical protein ACE5HS_16120 [bacterium]
MIKHRQKLPQFVLAKSDKNTTHGRSKLHYYKHFEIALIITLVGVILGFRVASHIGFEKYLQVEDRVVLEFLDIPEIPPEVEPPPKLKMEEVVELPMEEDKTENEDLTEEIEELLGENEEEVELALNSSNLNNYLTSGSGLGALRSTGYNSRKKYQVDDGGIALNRGKFYADLGESGGLDIGKVKTKERSFVSDENKIELPTRSGNLSRDKVEMSKPEENGEPKLGLSGLPEKILSFGSSTIGTEHYKLWNKLNSELDRLYKGRYGSTPKAIKRNRRGFLINFSFSDGTKQEIHWRNDGNVWIKVVGNSHKTAVQELQRALRGLLDLTLSN